MKKFLIIFEEEFPWDEKNGDARKRLSEASDELP